MAGGQAIGKFADWIGLFMSAMWRKESLPFIRENWPVITRPGSNHPWTTRKLGELIGLKS